jgi:hypothetical protein
MKVFKTISATITTRSTTPRWKNPITGVKKTANCSLICNIENIPFGLKNEEYHKQLENLSFLINEFLNSQNEERMVLYMEDFGRIKYLSKSNERNKNYWHILDYNDGCSFILSDYDSYDREHYTKLMNGELDRLILNKRDNSAVDAKYILNNKLEPIERTKLHDLYGSIEDESKLIEIQNLVPGPRDQGGEINLK